MHKVTIYSSQNSPICEMAKYFFDKNGINYEDIVDSSISYHDVIRWFMEKKEIRLPVIIINKDGVEKVIAGFNKRKISMILGLNLQNS